MFLSKHMALQTECPILMHNTFQYMQSQAPYVNNCNSDIVYVGI